MESSQKNILSPTMDSFQQNAPSHPEIESSEGKIPRPPVKNSNISKGRKKTVLKKIENEAKRKVTFSKRRSGIFKKSSEIATLCGAEAAIIIFSPSDKVFSFGSPSVDAVTNRFHRHTTLGITGENQIPDEQVNPIVRQRNQELTELGRTLDEEKQQQNRQKKILRQPRIEELSFDQLSDLRDFILKFKHAFETKLQIEAGGLGGGPNNQGQHDYNVEVQLDPTGNNSPAQ